MLGSGHDPLGIPSQQTRGHRRLRSRSRRTDCRTCHVRVGAPVAPGLPLHARRRERRPRAHLGRAVDAACPSPVQTGPRHARARQRHRPLGGGDRRGHAVRREAGAGDDVRRLGALGARRGQGAAARLRVLVPLRGRRPRQPRRTDPDRARAGDLGGGADVRVGVVPGLRLRVLHVLPAHRRGRPRLRAAPRRLRLRVRHERDGREPRDAGAPDRAAGAEQPRAVAGHACPLQAGPEPAGGAPTAAVRADVGRPRVLQRLRRGRAGSGRRRYVADSGRRRTRRTGSTCRCGRRRASSPARSASTAGCRSAVCCSST